MTSPTDIITYVGIPLAVAGVLPIIAVVLKTFLFSLHVRSQLKTNLNVVGLYKTPFWSTIFPPSSTVTSKRNGNPILLEERYFEKIPYYSIDVDVLTGQVNLSYPTLQLRILPENHAYYKKMRGDVEKRSRLRGGSWTVLYFVPELVQKDESQPEDESRIYVLKPTDNICQRPVSVNFASLVRYLLNLGAVANSAGWAELHKDGLGVPNRTVLLTSRRGRPVLVVRKQEAEEDDQLLAVLLDCIGVRNLFEEPSLYMPGSNTVPTVPIRHGLQPASGGQTIYHTELKPSQQDPIDVTISRECAIRASSTSSETGKVTTFDVSHMTSGDSEFLNLETWIASVTFVVGVKHQISYTQNYTGYVIPPPLFDFAYDAYNIRPFIPCGVLYHCGFIREEDCAPWKSELAAVTGLESRYNRHNPHPVSGPNGLAQGSSPHTHQATPADSVLAVQSNQVLHALSSPRWTVNTIGERMNIWLHEHFMFDNSATVTDIAEYTLHRMLWFPEESKDIGEMLSHWNSWYEAGCCHHEGVQYIQGHKITFALVACVLYALGRHTHTKDARTPGLTERCLKRWDAVLIY